jgi:hypothetical protein
MSLHLNLYSEQYKGRWDSFVSQGKNGMFLFYRDYMDYHSDRFIDHSLMIYEGKELVALLPANLEGKVLASHNGLTFGGFITNSSMTAATMLKIFDQLMDYLAAKSINKLIYKCIPYTYHPIPAEEDKYALFRKGAKLFRRDVTSTVLLSEKVRFQEIRRRSIKKATSGNLQVKKVDDFESYWDILKVNLAERHSTKPVHSLPEIEYLHSKFPDNIKLFASYQGNAMLAGVVVYESTNVAHAQYIGSSEEGRKMGALDAVFSYLIEEYYQDKRYFDFGISTENEGRYLNEGLIFFKEGFGARAVVHDFYELDVHEVG